MEKRSIVCPCCNQKLIVFVEDGEILIEYENSLSDTEIDQVLKELKIEFG